jgi:signal recognition particle receptor subunit beta
MVQFNFSERTIKAKVVYYGPAQSGKTTNLEQIHRLTDPGGTNRLISLNTAQDRTLFFDLLPFSLGAVSGYDFKVQLYTVPGQVQYNATRRVVLAGADAVVFVADSRKTMAKENQAAFENMKVNLLANRLVPEKVPLVLQYNKQDLPDLQTPEEMSKVLNAWKRPNFQAVAAQGTGVMDTFVAVVQEMLSAIAVKYNLKEKGLDPASVPEVVSQAFAVLMKQAAASGAPAPGAAAAPAAPAKVVLAQVPEADHGAPLQATPETGLVSEELLHRSIRSNVELAEALAGLVREMNVGLGTILSHSELLLVYKEDAREKRLAAIKSIQAEATRLRRVMQELGNASAPAGAPAPAGPAAPPRPAAPAPAPPTRPVPVPPAAAAKPATAAAPAVPGFDALLKDALNHAKNVLDGRGVSVELRVPAGTPAPRVPPQTVQRALSTLLQGVVTISPPGWGAILHCEKKPVLLKSKDGGQVKRDFLMLALAHGGNLSPDEQLRILQGADSGPFGEACRAVREAGGFVRFAPLPGGGLETRLFLPS